MLKYQDGHKNDHGKIPFKIIHQYFPSSLQTWGFVVNKNYKIMFPIIIMWKKLTSQKKRFPWSFRNFKIILHSHFVCKYVSILLFFQWFEPFERDASYSPLPPSLTYKIIFTRLYMITLPDDVLLNPRF